MNTKPQNRDDAALGCFLGACVGDAAGAVLEFIGHKPSETEVEHALTMPGGGALSVAPGQITDDSELALCLARALANSPTFNLEKIAQNYAKWVESNPFDMGGTTRNSLGCFLDYEWQTVCQQQGYAVGMTQAAQKRCMTSKANGSLMRAAPLGIWGHRFDDNELAYFAEQDSSLSHPNESCRQAVACYVIAISSLINQPGERKTAFERAKQWADAHANAEVNQWLQEAENNSNIPYYPQTGFIKIAFVHAFRHLVLETNYIDAIKETLAGGGDTDTNACIVGGLIGAACGAEHIPNAMKHAVLDCNSKLGRYRPFFLHATQVPELTQQLLSFDIPS